MARMNKGALLRPYSFNINVMRQLIFLLISGFLHLLVVRYFYFTFDEVSIVNKHQSLSAVLLNENISNNQSVTQDLIDPKKFEPIEAKKKTFSNTQEIDSNPVSQIQPEPIDINHNQKTVELKDYYSNTEVDRKALALMNIDQSMLANEESSGLPIKVRLYINAFGIVVKVEPIAVLDQDAMFAEKLAKLLYEVRFLPAKREGLDVDSYQDLQLSFNPIAVPNINNNQTK